MEEKLIEMIKIGRVKYHHTSWARGYVRVNHPEIAEYSGKFGKGFTVETHSDSSTRYHQITYFIYTHK